MKRFFSTVDTLSKASAWLAVFGLFSLSAMITVATLSRYFLNRPILGIDEISGYLNLLIGMLAVAYTLNEGRHVQVDMLTQHLSRKTRDILGIITTILALILVGQLLRSGLYSWLSLVAAGERADTVLMTPLAIPYGLMLLGWVLLVLAMVVYLLKRIDSLLHPKERVN